MKQIRRTAQIRLGFGREDRRRLHNALRAIKDVRAFRRVQAVLLVCCGHSPDQTAQIVGLSRRSVYNALRRYLRKRDAADLLEAPRSGRPRASGAITDARILKEIKRDPLKLGYMTTEWTAGLLAKHLFECYGCPITTATLRRRLRAIGYRWKRPRYRYSTRAKHLAQKKGPFYAV